MSTPCPWPGPSRLLPVLRLFLPFPNPGRSPHLCPCDLCCAGTDTAGCRQVGLSGQPLQGGEHLHSCVLTKLPWVSGATLNGRQGQAQVALVLGVREAE